MNTACLVNMSIIGSKLQNNRLLLEEVFFFQTETDMKKTHKRMTLQIPLYPCFSFSYEAKNSFFIFYFFIYFFILCLHMKDLLTSELRSSSACHSAASETMTRTYFASSTLKKRMTTLALPLFLCLKFWMTSSNFLSLAECGIFSVVEMQIFLARASSLKASIPDSPVKEKDRTIEYLLKQISQKLKYWHIPFS